MEPSEQPEASRASSSSGVRPSRPPASRDFRTVHSAYKRGGGPRPGESVRRAAVTPDDLREGYLVWDVTQTRRFHRCWTSAVTPHSQVSVHCAHNETKRGSDTQILWPPLHPNIHTTALWALHTYTVVYFTVKPALNALKIRSVGGLHMRWWFKEVPNYFSKSSPLTGLKTILDSLCVRGVCQWYDQHCWF